MRSSSRRIALLAALLAPTLTTVTASADDKAICIQAAQQAQNLRDAHELVEAREQLRVCARQECPPVVQRDCLIWLDSVEKSLPTVVVTARDDAGVDRVDVKVMVDGKPTLDRLDGSAVPINPGMHAFHFVGSDGTTSDQQVLIKEGQINQGVAVVLKRGLPEQPPPPAPTARLEVVPPGRATQLAPSPARGGHSVAPWIVIAVGGAAVLGGAILYPVGSGMVSSASAQCPTHSSCDTSSANQGNSGRTLEAVGLVVGAVGLAAVVGGVIWHIVDLTGPSTQAGPVTRLFPVVTPNCAGIAVGGGF
jgi:hypothetical protein